MRDFGRCGWLIAVLILELAGSAAAVSAETELVFSGQVRSRTELDGKSFEGGATTMEFTDLRTRLALEAIIESSTHVFIQLQDSRRLGAAAHSEEQTSGTLYNARNVDMHQAYLRIDRLFAGGWGLQVGRFEVNLGNQRVFGSVGWNNVGRSWEGMDGWYRNDTFQVAGYWLKKLARENPSDYQDFNIFGLNARIEKLGLELLAFYERDSNTHGFGDDPHQANALDRYDVGFYFSRLFESISLTANGVYQFGNRLDVGIPAAVERDISAYLLTAEAGYVFDADMHLSLAAGVDYASGDDDAGDDTWKAYDNLYYTGHKFRGFMDYFVASNREGLLDLMAKASVAPVSGWKLQSAVHYFRTAQEYADFEGNDTRAAGIEIDLTATTTRIAGVTIDGGCSIFLPDDSFAGEKDADPGVWGYVMLAGNFGE